MMRRCFGAVVVAVMLGTTQGGCVQNPKSEQPPSSNARTETDGPAAAKKATERPRTAGKWWVNPKTVAELDLSEEQVQKIDAIMSEVIAEAREQTDRERTAATRFHRALNQDPYDPALVDRMSANLEEVIISNTRRKIKKVRALRDILTHEQWKKLWHVAPRALQVSQVRIFMGPTVYVTDGTPIPVTPTPEPGD